MTLHYLVFGIVLWLISVGFAWGHSWYGSDCCSAKDCYEVEESTLLERMDLSWLHLPTSLVFTRAMRRPSQDGRYHICHTPPDAQGRLGPRCIYVPPRSY